jgi:hypothetical protein
MLVNCAEGMDLNPLFTGAMSFRPAGAGGELKLFEQVQVKLVHGWLVDPESKEAQVFAKVQDYDRSLLCTMYGQPYHKHIMTAPLTSSLLPITQPKASSSPANLVFQKRDPVVQPLPGRKKSGHK